MRVHNVLIDLHTGYGNKPTFIVQVDELPNRNDVLFEKRVTEDGNGLYFGYTEDGYVRFYSYREPGRGYSGATFSIMMREDGKEIDLVGPWASRAGVMNKVGFPEVVDVVYQYGNRQEHGHILADTLYEYLGINMVRRKTKDGEYTFEPTVS